MIWSFKPSKDEQAFAKLLQNSFKSLRVVGRGCVTVDASEVQQSESFKQSLIKAKDLVKGIAMSDQPPVMRGKYRKQFEASVKEAVEEKQVSEANDLIKRIDESFFFVVDLDGQQRLDKLLADCRAEIEHLTKVLEVTDENHGRTTVLAHKALKDLDIANAEIERLTQSNQCLRDQNTALDEKLAEYSERTYTPMTDDEMTEVIAQWYEDDSNTNALTRQIEQAVVKRIMGS